jgi:hypothetical protein
LEVWVDYKINLSAVGAAHPKYRAKHFSHGVEQAFMPAVNCHPFPALAEVNGKKMMQSQSRRKKKNRRKLARATARYFRKLDDEAVKEENQLAARLRLTKQIIREIDRS